MADSKTIAALLVMWLVYGGCLAFLTFVLQQKKRTAG